VSATLAGTGAVHDDDVRPSQRTPARARRCVGPPLLAIAVVAVGMALPMIRNRIFYFWDDSAAVAGPWYRVIATEVVHGRLPLLEVGMWRGGNLAAEAASGMWNPVVVAAAIATLPVDNLALALTLMKALFLAIMGLGTYLLCRDYGAGPWPAAAIGAALPLSGYTLFMDATSWVNGLLVAAFTPWVWWSARRAVQGRGSPVWVVVAGYLCGSVGNPYGMLTAAVALGAVLVEAAVTGHARRIPGIVLAGLAIVLTNVVVYLPFLDTSSVTYRDGDAHLTASNTEFLSPSLSDLAGASTPSFQPYMATWELPYWSVPVMYIAWFLLPLLPWVRWRRLASTWRSCTALWIFGGVFLLLVLGPTQIWLFRWPLRLLPFLALVLGVLWAVLASGELHRTRRPARAAASAAIVGFGGWMAWSSMPDLWQRAVLGTLLVCGLVAVLVVVGAGGRAGFAVLAIGTLAVLGLQVAWFPANENVTIYRFPNSQRLLEERFADRYEGVTVQVANQRAIAPDDLNPDGAYRDLLFGSLYRVAGVESTTAYSGIGFTAFERTLCMNYQGSTCPAAWSALWERPAGYDVPLADLLRAQTVVVQNSLLDTRAAPAPDGWRRSEQTSQATVWKRTDPLPWPGGRLSHVTAGTSVSHATLVGPTDERLVVVRSDPARPAVLTFARLAWPGYSATLDGEPVPTHVGPAGLLQIELPPGTAGGELLLSYATPGLTLGAQAMAAGAALTALLGLGHAVSVRRRRRPIHDNQAHAGREMP
jgi:hypothetical protein